MHSWDVMATSNFDHNWYSGGGGVGIVGTTNIIKNEPQDMTSFQGLHHQITNHNSNNQHTESNPTSPQSMDSSVDSTNQTGFYDTTFFGINKPLRPIGFNPLTPPGYSGVSILQQQHHLQQQQQQTHLHLNQTPIEQEQTQEQQLITPSKNYIKAENSSFNNNAVTTSTLTPSHTPPMDVTPPKSPKDNIQQTPDKDVDNISNCIDSEDTHSMGSDLEDDNNMRTPKVNSHGKIKTFKCKQCDFVAMTKLVFWDHTKSHIKPEKMLKCLKCPFVTEYKHHLEYHMRNHDGSKPFQCNQCTYSCVNKSMLNSHLKSHSTIYQYRCQDCNYATKYCHSLKLHLRKYAHKPAMVLNQDGTPNPLPIIDVYGTRRGPKTKSSKGSRKGDDSKSFSRQKRLSLTKHNLVSQMLPNTLANMLQSGTNLSLFPYLNIHMLAAHQQAALVQQLSPNIHHDDRSERSYDSDDSDNRNDNNTTECNITPNKVNAAALDLTQCIAKRILNNQIMLNGRNIDDLGEEESDENDSKIISSSEQMIVDEDDSDEKPTASAESNSSPSTPSINGGFKNRRKGRAFKLAIVKGLSEDEGYNNDDPSKTYKNDSALDGDDEDDDDQQTILANKINNNERLTNTTNLTKQYNINNNNNNDFKGTTPFSPTIYECKFCEITFKDAVLYTIHMGYHGYNDVFKCNMCGEKCDDRVAFFLHIARNPHS